MSMINKEVSDFTVQAFQDGAFQTVTKSDILGKWSVFFFYPADFTFVCPTELEDLADKYEEFQAAGRKIHFLIPRNNLHSLKQPLPILMEMEMLLLHLLPFLFQHNLYKHQSLLFLIFQPPFPKTMAHIL